MVRINAGPITNNGTPSAVYQTPSFFLSYVQNMTGYTLSGSTWTKVNNNGVVCMIEDHDNNLAQPPFTGAALTVQTNWYTALAQYFNGNPYVWFGTQNEMNSPNGTYATSDIAGMTPSHVAIYNAIRVAGGNSGAIVSIMAGIGGSNTGTLGANAGFVVSSYATMTNIIWEIHAYANNGDTFGQAGGWTSVSQYITGGAGPVGGGSGGWGILAAQTIQSADGVVPCVFGEWGAADGSQTTTDASQMASALQSVQSSGNGSLAWAYSVGGGEWVLVNNAEGGPYSLTTWGTVAAGVIATNPSGTEIGRASCRERVYVLV